MRFKGWIICTAAVLGLSASVTVAPSGAQPAALAAASARLHEDTPEPIVVELFTAQGCSGCPEANRAVEAIADEPGVIALTYAVDYWDYLGWPDTFARPEFAARQRAYRSALRLRNVSTPQVIVDGRRPLSGARTPDLQLAINQEAARRGFPPEIEFRETGDRVGVGSGRAPAGGAEVLAVTYRPGAQVVEVGGGDNRGQSVRHVNVVRDVRKLGDWNGRPILLNLPDDLGEGDGLVVLVQATSDRRIIAAAGR